METIECFLLLFTFMVKTVLSSLTNAVIASSRCVVCGEFPEQWTLCYHDLDEYFRRIHQCDIRGLLVSKVIKRIVVSKVCYGRLSNGHYVIMIWMSILDVSINAVP